jgi:hypothetical protein
MAHAVEVAGVEQADSRVERGVDRRDALSPVGPYIPDIPMQPRPRAETDGPLRPSERCSMMVFSLRRIAI